MRLWDYRLLKVLPDRFIISQWRECIAIKRQWEKGTLKHRLVSYVMNYNKNYFLSYVINVICVMINRDIKYQDKYYEEIINFCKEDGDKKPYDFDYYPEHNDRYLKQCFYNLEEKYDRGIINKEEWAKIEEFWDDFIREKLIEEKIIIKYCTEAFIEKEYQKIVNEKQGWRSQYIPMLLSRVFYELINEETWHFIKEFHNPKINFKTLNALTIQKVKEVKKEVFN